MPSPVFIMRFNSGLHSCIDQCTCLLQVRMILQQSALLVDKRNCLARACLYTRGTPQCFGSDSVAVLDA